MDFKNIGKWFKNLFYKKHICVCTTRYMSINEMKIEISNHKNRQIHLEYMMNSKNEQNDEF